MTQACLLGPAPACKCRAAVQPQLKPEQPSDLFCSPYLESQLLPQSAALGFPGHRIISKGRGKHGRAAGLGEDTPPSTLFVTLTVPGPPCQSGMEAGEPLLPSPYQGPTEPVPLCPALGSKEEVCAPGRGLCGAGPAPYLVFLFVPSTLEPFCPWDPALPTRVTVLPIFSHWWVWGH